MTGNCDTEYKLTTNMYLNKDFEMILVVFIAADHLAWLARPHILFGL